MLQQRLCSSKEINFSLFFSLSLFHLLHAFFLKTFLHIHERDDLKHRGKKLENGHGYETEQKMKAWKERDLHEITYGERQFLLQRAQTYVIVRVQCSRERFKSDR